MVQVLVLLAVLTEEPTVSLSAMELEVVHQT